MADGEENKPKDAKTIKALMVSMGINDYEPRVERQFMELYYRCAVDVLIDAKTYSKHAGKSTIDNDDVKLSIEFKSNFGSTLPTIEQMKEEAMKVNSKELPMILTVGPALPPVRDTLISPNYHFQILKNDYGVEVQEEEKDVNEGPSIPKPVKKRRSNLPSGRRQRVSFPLAMLAQGNGYIAKLAHLCLLYGKSLMQTWIDKWFL